MAKWYNFGLVNLKIFAFLQAVQSKAPSKPVIKETKKEKKEMSLLDLDDCEFLVCFFVLVHGTGFPSYVACEFDRHFFVCHSSVEPAPSPQVTPVNSFLSSSLVTDLEGLSLSDSVLSPAVRAHFHPG